MYERNEDYDILLPTL